MKKSIPYAKACVSILLILAIMVMSLAGALMVRLKKGPWDLEFARTYIEKALSDKEQGYKVEFGKAYLVWPKMSDPFLIDADQVKVSQNDKTILDVDDFSFSLSGLGLLQGKIRPSRIIIDAPKIALFDDSGKINEAIANVEAEFKKDVYGPQLPPERKTPKAVVVEPKIKDIRVQVKETLAQLAQRENSDFPYIEDFKEIKIKNAVIEGANNLELAKVSVNLKKDDTGLIGDLIVDYPEKEGVPARFKSDVLYRKLEGDLTLSAKVKDLHTSHLTPFLRDFKELRNQDLFLNGDVKAAFDQDLKLQMATVSLNMPDSSFRFPDIYTNPINVKDLMTKINFNRAENALSLSNFTANVSGIPVEANLIGNIADKKFSAPLVVKISETKPENIRSLLPDAERNSSLGQWVNKRLTQGTVSNVLLLTDLEFSRNPETKKLDTVINKPKMTFDFTGMTVTYSDTLTPVKKSNGRGIYEDDSLKIEGDIGYIKDIVGKNVRLNMTKLSVEGGGQATIKLNANGPLKSALQFASDEPINAGGSLGFDINKVKGNVNFDLDMSFPTIKNLPKEQVKVKLKGKVNELVLPQVVKGLNLTGSGYDLAFDKGAVTLKGKGKLGDYAADIDWFQYLDSNGKDFETRIKASVTGDQQLRDIFGIGLEDYISGPIPLNVTYTDRGVKAEVDIVGDLTPTTLHIDPFDYKKPAGVKGDLTLKAHLNKDDLIKVTNLKLKTKDLEIANGEIFFQKLKDGSTDIKNGTVPTLSLKNTKTAVKFSVSNDNVLTADLNGSVVDISSFIKSDKKAATAKPADEQAMNVNINATKLIGQNGTGIMNAKLYLELNKQKDPTRIQMSAAIGDGSMRVSFQPNSTGARDFYMETTDAGHTLKFFGLYDKMRGGVLVISGQPKNANVSDLYGVATIKDFNIKKAPGLAKLLGAMSLKGVGSLLNNDGISFEQLKSNFEWKFNETGNLLVIKNGRTSGNSLGLTFEGFVNMGTKTTDISGTIIPVSGLNSAVGKIPLIGDILTGGDALIAATYKMKGASSDPSITVNPLSVLAPGFLRKIFFEDNVDAKVKKEESRQ